jgi:tRNA(Arg) A34 adenosine deaminase TadA
MNQLPVGAVIVNREGEVMAQSYDFRDRDVDPLRPLFDASQLHHAVMNCIHKVTSFSLFFCFLSSLTK